MSFTSDQIAYLDANAEMVEARRLFEMTVMGETIRLAESEIEVTTPDGKVWLPGLQIIEASTVTREEAFQAIPMQYRVAGLSSNPTDEAQDSFDGMRREILHNVDGWHAGEVHQLLQLLVDGKAVGPAISLHRGWLSDARGEESVDHAVFALTVESIFARRNRTPLGDYTDRDQQRRQPGDKGCAFTPTLAEKTVTGWPF